MFCGGQPKKKLGLLIEKKMNGRWTSDVCRFHTPEKLQRTSWAKYDYIQFLWINKFSALQHSLRMLTLNEKWLLGSISDLFYTKTYRNQKKLFNNIDRLTINRSLVLQSIRSYWNLGEHQILTEYCKNVHNYSTNFLAQNLSAFVSIGRKHNITSKPRKKEKKCAKIKCIWFKN